MNRQTRSAVIIIALSGFFLLVTRILFLDIMTVSGLSMEPTLGEGTVILVNKLGYGLIEPISRRYLFRWAVPTPGELVVFVSPLDEKISVKRCVAVAGDRLTARDGALYVGDRKIALKFFQKGIVEQIGVVPENHIFVVGDHEEASSDSRTYGPLSVDRVLGRVLLPADQGAL